MNGSYLGSDFDDFLKEEGILAEVEATAIKRVFAFKIKKMMEDKNVSKTELARRMKTSRASVNRLLDPENRSITLQTMEGVALVMDARLKIDLVQG